MRQIKISMKMLLGAVFVASVSFAFYACSADQQGWEEDMENELELRANAMSKSVKLDTKLDSVMDSEEFVDYVVAAQALQNGITAFFSSLSEEEKKEMEQAAVWSNMGDDRCVPAAMKLYEALENEFTAYRNAVKRLSENTPYLALNEQEREFFFKYSTIETGITMMKSRSPENDCQQKKEELAQAARDLETATKLCNDKYENDPGNIDYAACLLSAAVEYNKTVEEINKKYKDCD